MIFEVLTKDPKTRARRGRLQTAHGFVETPVFMPVGTQATVKSMTGDQLQALNVEILLCNAYHLLLRPGHETIQQLGGLHRFMAWDRPILTDSGGYQVFSLSTLRDLDEDGVRFQSHLDGSTHFLSPEKAIDVQAALGSDIMMILDDCLAYPASRFETEKSMHRSLVWAERCKKHWEGRTPGEIRGQTGQFPIFRFKVCLQNREFTGLTPNLQLALRFDLIFLCQCRLDWGDQLAPNPVVLRITMISKEEVIPDRPLIVRMHQLGQRSCPAGLFPLGD